LDYLQRLLPGLLLCSAITIAATLLEDVEVYFTGGPYLESLVIAILLGVIVRTIWTPGPTWIPGIGFSAKFVLECAIVMLGALVSAATVFSLINIRHRVRCFVDHRLKLRDMPVARLDAASVNSDRVRQFDLRQFGHCRDRPGHRRRER
jgi:Conserved hypothetical protein 698